MMATPKYLRTLGTSFKRATSDDDSDDEDALELSAGQTEARVQRQFQNDKTKAIVNRRIEIKRAETALSRTQDPPFRKQLKQKIDKLEAENQEEQRF